MTPTCPVCRRPMMRLQRSRGVVAVPPCGHWLTPAAAETLVAAWREQQEAA